MTVGRHLIRAYLKTQDMIAKWSAESELYGVIHASTGGLGILTLLSDFGGMDATAALGLAQ